MQQNALAKILESKTGKIVFAQMDLLDALRSHGTAASSMLMEAEYVFRNLGVKMALSRKNPVNRRECPPS